ncbi:MAG: tetratricopeptide repeat protein [Rhizobiaceae bacterium]
MKKLFLTFSLSLLVASAATAQPRVSPAIGTSLVQLAQADSSFQVQQLEEEVRRLNGKVEELNFLLLQLQEKLRKMEEDNEGRFQEIEEKQSDAGGEKPDDNQDVAVAAQPETGGSDRLEKPEASETEPASDVTQNSTESAAASPRTPPKPRGLAPRALGTLTFDENGNVVDARPQDEQQAGLPDSSSWDEALNASEFGATPNEVLSAGKNAINSKDYETAQRALSAHRAAWPNDPSAGQVLHYLGKAQFWQKNYFESANAHLEAHKNFPEATTAPDNLLGLGLALAGLNQREVACATYAEVIKQYPESEPRLGERVKNEQASAKC